MAGKSSRFFEAGYQDFKYKLKINGESLFSRSLDTFRNYFNNGLFHIGYLGKYVEKEFLESELASKGIKKYYLYDLHTDTSGQAETVYQTVKNIENNFPLVIFNIDTKRTSFILNDEKKVLFGYIEVFEGEGDHWSFIRINDNDEIIEVTEKIRVSNLCSNGMYVFKNIETFTLGYNQIYYKGYEGLNETFVMPIYQFFIDNKMPIGYELVPINQHEFFGTPLEYEALRFKNE